MIEQKYNPLISIVIPAYNAANFLAEAINSALAQTYKNIEIIVVNDGSNDNGATRAIAEKYSKKIRYFEKENGGSSSALNCGIANMKGDWFSWLSHDDLYLPNKVKDEVDYLNLLLENGVKIAELKKYILVASADLIDGNGKIIQKCSAHKIKKTSNKINCKSGTLNLIAEPVQAGFHGCSCLIHKEALKKVGAFNEKLRLLNDMDLWFKLYISGHQFYYLPKVLVKGRVHSEQVSRSIGFSYHNSEQDMFWNRSFEWLCNNQPNNYQLFYLFGKTAYLKTRMQDGKRAFKKAGAIKKWQKPFLAIKTVFFKGDAVLKNTAKQLYLKFRV